MKTNLSVAILLAFAVSASAITIETVPIGNVGNPNDPATGNLYGGVDYAYSIGRYEVTLGQYAAFLNTVATTDTYGLYNVNMATDLRVAGIARDGSPGSYSYSVIGSANHPVAIVSWGDAARFANWLSNGQPTGAQGPATTETGAYTLNGAITADALNAVTRNVGASWFIPTDNEWYKAAFYQPAETGGDADGYWAYPMRTNSAPYSDQPPGATPDNTRVGNFYKDDQLADGYDDGIAVTGSTVFSDTQNYLTDVGAYTLSPSYYGTFDQAGNVDEWTETKGPVSNFPNPTRRWHGASFLEDVTWVRASGGFYSNPTFDSGIIGFRVASSTVPEPSVFISFAFAVVILFTSDGRKHRAFGAC